MAGDWKCSRRAFLTVGGTVAARGQMTEGKEIVVSEGAVAGEPDDAARAGARILAEGGNAMEAAAAACLASGTVQPETADIGGYVFCAVVLEASSGRLWTLDANSVAPAAAHERMYQVGPLAAPATGINATEYSCSVKDDANVYGPLAVGVPGVMGGIGTLWERWGRLKWPQIVAPSLRLLADGFPYRTTAAAIRQEEKAIRKFEATARHLMPRDKAPRPEDRWSRPDLAKTLERIASAGWRDFYEGEIGRKIADSITGAGGILIRRDMAAFRPRVEETYSTPYRRAQVHGARRHAAQRRPLLPHDSEPAGGVRAAAGQRPEALALSGGGAETGVARPVALFRGSAVRESPRRAVSQ
jgi:gamma-glutamyltranspeptidase/glutathione hydrolase